LRFVEVSALGRLCARRHGLAAAPGAGPGGAHHDRTFDLQRYIAQIFPAGQRGAVLALNPNTGEISPCTARRASIPNAFVGGVDPDYWRRLNVSEAHPLFDRTIQARYSAGSTWKLALATMALRRGIVTLRSRMPIPCRGASNTATGSSTAGRLKGTATWSSPMRSRRAAMCTSISWALKLGLTSMLEDATGLGSIPARYRPPRRDHLRIPGWHRLYDRVYGPRRWTAAVTLNLAIGQGENAQTLVNMIRFYQMLASDGPGAISLSRASPPPMRT